MRQQSVIVPDVGVIVVRDGVGLQQMLLCQNITQPNKTDERERDIELNGSAACATRPLIIIIIMPRCLRRALSISHKGRVVHTRL